MKIVKMRLPVWLIVVVLSATASVVLGSPVPNPNEEGTVVEEPQIKPEELPADIGEPSDEDSISEEESVEHSHHHHHHHVDVQPIKAELQPVEPIKAGLQPVEPINAGLQPVEPINANLQPVEPISGGLEPGNFPKSCTQPPLTGLCRGAFPMFYFDPSSRTCKQFVYGGCKGNRNIHKTSDDCYRKCYPQGLQTTAVVSGRSSQNDYLTIRDGTGASILTFTGTEAAARIDPVVLGDFTITNVYAFAFHFRTDSPHGLIAYLRQVTVPGDHEGVRIQLYVHLTKGHLTVTHVLAYDTETFVMRKGGLQAGNWHSAYVLINAETGELTMEVDNNKEYFTINSLTQTPHYTGEQHFEGFASLLWVGGVFEAELENEAMVHGFAPFHGCIQQMSVSSGESPANMRRVQPLVATEHSGVKEHCADNCNDRYTNLCSPKSHCVEHFDHNTCNCFNSGQDGPKCDNPAVPILTLNGDGYVVHRLYEWMDRVHSYSNLISIGFKTRFTDSILFYASAEHPERQYIAASITKDGQVYVEVNLGGGVANASFGTNIMDTWRKLIIVHQHEKIMLYLDNTLKATLIIPGNIRYMHLDPNVYIGNAPRLARECGLALDRGSETPSDGIPCTEGGQHYYYDKHSGNCHSFNYTGCGGNANRFPDEASCKDACYAPGLRSMNTFLGCLKWVFFNDVSILQSLSDGKKATKYYGSTKEAPIGDTCSDTKFLPVTFSTERAAMKLINPRPRKFHLILSFKPTQPRGVLASGVANVSDYDSLSEWELRHDSNHVYFYLHDNLMSIKSDGKIKLGHWQYVEVRYDAGRINMMVNNKKQGKQGPGKLLFSADVTIGRNSLEDFPGFIGCIRELHIGGTSLDLRTVVGTPLVNKDVTYDNCQVLGPCEGPRGCEHGGECIINEDGEPQCDCSGTGYSGKKCHFSLYKRSCEQYRQMGYNSSGIYRIDVDGNGPLPPSYVKCDFNSLLQETYTIIEHNVEKEYEVRKKGMRNFRLDVNYRDFTPEMLQYIISQSESCSQEVMYECRRSPLLLSTRTWFSSPAEKFISNYGTRNPGVCRCTELKSCDSPKYPCNCDINDGVPRRDKALITNPQHLPLTSMVFLQGDDQREDSEALITLHPLVCVAQAVKEHTISFTDSASYLEVPAWREGSLLLTFRTTSKTAIVAYQPAHHPSHATLMISLVGDNQLEFMYHYRGIHHQQVIRTSQPLNDGQWQQILVDVYNHQLRFVINNDEKIVEVDPNTYLGVLDGSMYLGGIPEEFKEMEGSESQLEGLVGCIKGLTINDEVVDLKKLLRATARGVVLGCNPSCDPNPCKNGAACIEKWGSYECQCTNPLAHSGQNCETNLNDDAITFTTEDAKYKHFSNATERYGENILSESFLLNFRTHSSSGLILFAYNHLHNFVQLHLAKKNQVVFMFNHGHEMKKIEVTAENDVVFNKGQSVQMKIERSDSATSFTVYTEGHTYTETLDVDVLLLHEDQYQQFPYEDREAYPERVYYPHSMTKPTPFFLLYLGSANDKKHDIRSLIPGMVGCIRGLKVGEQLVSLPKLLAGSPDRTDGVIANCKMACDQNPCLNGGRCTENFQRFSNFRCDCSSTSYMGGNCKSETSYTFHGNDWIADDSSSSPLDSNFKFELAFSTSSSYSESQIVALLRSTNPSKQHDYLLIWLGSDGSINVEGEFQDLDPDNVNGVAVSPEINNINAFDGYRHYIAVEKKGGDWSIKIDKKEYEKSALRSVYIEETEMKAAAPSLFLGGIEEGLDDRLTHYANFRGCISNVRVRTPEGDSQPLKMYSEGNLHMRNRGLPGQGKCAPFFMAATTHGKLMIKDNERNTSGVLGSEWIYNRPMKMAYQAPAPVRDEHVRDTAFDNVVPIVAGTVIAIAIVIAVLLLLRSHSKKKMEKKFMDQEEKKPLFNGRKTEPSHDVRTQSLYIVSKDETVPLKSAPEELQISEKVAESKSKTSEEVPLEEIAIAEKEPATESEDVPDVVPQVVVSEEKDDTGEVEVHNADSGENEEVQEERVAPLSTGDDSSSSSDLEFTMDVSSTPEATPTDASLPAPEEVDSAAVEQPEAQPPSSEGTSVVPCIDDQPPSDPDAQPVLKSYTVIGEDGTTITTDFDKVPTVKIEKSGDESAEINVVDDESTADQTVKSDTESSTKDEIVEEESVKVETSAPMEVGKDEPPETEKTESEKSEPADATQDSKEIPDSAKTQDAVETEKPDIQEKESSDPPQTTESKGEDKSSSDSDEDIEVRQESTKVEVAQRMSKDVPADGDEEDGLAQAQLETPESGGDLGETNGSSSSELKDEDAPPTVTEKDRQEIQKRLKKGRITNKENSKPIFLSENIRTFNNPISYLGGPTIEYEESEGGGRSRNDSLTSLTSITSLD